MNTITTSSPTANGGSSSQPSRPADNTESPLSPRVPVTRNGKIARLPRKIRDELNQRLEDGQQAKWLVRWLNSLPEVKEVLKAEFPGQPISEVNLTRWKQGGFLEWQDLQEKRNTLARFAEEADDLFQSEDDEDLAGRISKFLISNLALTARALIDSAPDPETRWQRLRQLIPELDRIRRDDLRWRLFDIAHQRARREEAKSRTGIAGVALANAYLQSTLEDTLKNISRNESRAATPPNDTKLR